MFWRLLFPDVRFCYLPVFPDSNATKLSFGGRTFDPVYFDVFPVMPTDSFLPIRDFEKNFRNHRFSLMFSPKCLYFTTWSNSFFISGSLIFIVFIKCRKPEGCIHVSSRKTSIFFLKKEEVVRSKNGCCFLFWDCLISG